VDGQSAWLNGAKGRAASPLACPIAESDPVFVQSTRRRDISLSGQQYSLETPAEHTVLVTLIALSVLSLRWTGVIHVGLATVS
jgi:hypothetical protein